jgi:hypothetical protein
MQQPATGGFVAPTTSAAKQKSNPVTKAIPQSLVTLAAALLGAVGSRVGVDTISVARLEAIADTAIALDAILTQKANR